MLNPELFLGSAVLLFAAMTARFGVGGLGWWERPLARVATKPALAIVVAAVSPLLLRAMLLPAFPAPQPRVHDEFSFLLNADTFSHGRLLNARHPGWVHFESMHILASPVYVSAFPAGPAAIMAIGSVFWGHPWAGVWLSVALMCGAICWMLQGYLPPRWALLGAILIVLRFGVSSYWMNSYWGGSLAAAGGALALGALPRLREKTSWTYAVIMGAGLAILANSRPFEGAMLGLAIAAALIVWIVRIHAPVRVLRAMVPLFAVLGVTAAAMAYYFARVTGTPWMPPYVLYRSTMTMAPHFLWQKPRPAPLYNNREMRNFYVESEMGDYDRARKSLLHDLQQKAAVYWRFYVGPLLTIPLVAALCLWRDRKGREMCLIAAAFSTALIGQVWHNAHYAAPATGLIILLIVMGLRYLRTYRLRGWPVGLCLVRCIPVACAVMLLIQIGVGRASSAGKDAAWRWPIAAGVQRAGIMRQLEQSGGEHLVFVRYGARHDTGDEWVYNGADIDGSRVVWARELDRESNAALMRYFAGRKVWLVEPDLPVIRAVLYEQAPVRPMPFVQIGAPGIAVLTSADTIRKSVLELAHRGDRQRFSCDEWNYLFTQTTGVQGPDVDKSCYRSERGEQVSFEQWFGWLLLQR